MVCHGERSAAISNARFANCDASGPRAQRLGFTNMLSFRTFALFICLAGTATLSAAERWRFIMTCDSRGSGATGINDRILREMTGEILRSNVDFVLFSGALVFGARIGAERFESQLWNWVRIMQPVYDAGIPVHICRGNHEVGDMWDAEPNEPPD